MIGLLLVVAVPTQASPIKFVEVINVMGDLNVSCLLDGKTPHPPEHDPELAAIA